MVNDLRLMRNIKIKAIFFVAFVLFFNHQPLILNPVFAQTPSSWQQNATGLKIQTYPDKKTAGLGFSVQEKSGPFLMMPGGLQDAGANANTGPVGISLGLIKNSTTAPVFSSESADWAHNELTYDASTANQLKITASRLSSAVLINNSTNALRLFSGDVFKFQGNTFTGRTLLKYVAYSSGGTIQVRALSATPLSLPALDNNWILIWFGNSSHFFESKQPNPYPYPISAGVADALNRTIAKSNSYQADAPLLLTFQNNPTNISQSPEGGVDVNFSATSGFTSVLPIFGRDHLKSSDTEGWGASQALPTNVTSRINFWTARACQYPNTVSESYSYDSNTDTATISDNISFVPVCSFSSTKFAHIPPMLGAVRNALGANLTFSGTLVDGNLPTDFGPTLGIDNVSSYSWNLKGINQYVNLQNPTISPASIPTSVMNQLKSEVDKITAAGHYSPWWMLDRMSNGPDNGAIYFLNPADTLKALTDIIPVLPEPQKTNLTNYLKSERTNYPPETIFNLVSGQGTLRGDFNVPDQNVPGASPLYTRWQSTTHPYAYMKRVWLYNFYSLAKYYQLTGETIPQSVLTAALATLDKDMSEQDYASLYWFKGFEDRRGAVVNANRNLAGLIGLTKIASSLNDQANTNLAKALTAKAIALRVGMAKTPQYQYAAGLVVLPTDPAWQPKLLAGNWNGVIFNYDWVNPIDDARQVNTLDQYGLTLHDNTGYMNTFSGWGGGYWNAWRSPSLSSFRDLTPETALLLKDYAKAESDNYIKKVENNMPHWYAAFAEGYLAHEHNLSHPIDSYQIFLAKSWINGESASSLERYSDIPFLSQGGDLFYVHKLAETAKAYAASGSPTPSISPSTAPAKPGDLDNNDKVDIFDYNILLTNFGKSGSGIQGDIDGNGKVDIFDYNNLLTNFGK